MNKVFQYVKESYNELMNKVTWPSWPNLQSTTIVVLIASVILSLIIFVMDIINNKVLTAIYDLNL